MTENIFRAFLWKLIIVQKYYDILYMVRSGERGCLKTLTMYMIIHMERFKKKPVTIKMCVFILT